MFVSVKYLKSKQRRGRKYLAPRKLWWDCKYPQYAKIHQLLHRNRDDLAQILGLLKTQIDPALLVRKDQEEGSSNNSPNPENEENKHKEDDGMFCEAIVSISLLFFCVWIVLY